MGIILSSSSGVQFVIPPLSISIQHWQSAQIKPVELYPSITYQLFITQVNEIFLEEIDGNNISIYTLPRKKDIIIGDKKLVKPQDFVSLVNELLSGNPNKLQLLIWNEEVADAHNSPTLLPGAFSNVLMNPTHEAESSNKNASTISRSTVNSDACKERDQFTCNFCGYSEPEDGDGLEAGHFAEIGTYRNMKPLERKQLLDSLELLTINDIINHITLCLSCHKYFDKKGGYRIGIEPSSLRLIIAREIRQKKNHLSGKPFIELHSKQVELKGALHHRPTSKLLNYRYDIFKAANRENPTKKNKLKESVPILYCDNCEFYTFVESEFSEHKMNCDLSRIKITDSV